MAERSWPRKTGLFGLSEVGEQDVIKCSPSHFPVGAALVTGKQRRPGKILELPLGATCFINWNRGVVWENCKDPSLKRPKPSHQFSSVAQSCPTLCDPMNYSMPGLPVHHQLPEFTQTHVHQVGDAIQPSHPLSSPSPPAPIPSQHRGLFQWVNSSHEVAKVLEFQPQCQSFQWTPRTDLL